MNITAFTMPADKARGKGVFRTLLNIQGGAVSEDS